MNAARAFLNGIGYERPGIGALELQIVRRALDPKLKLKH